MNKNQRKRGIQQISCSSFLTNINNQQTPSTLTSSITNPKNEFEELFSQLEKLLEYYILQVYFPFFSFPFFLF